MKGLNKDFVKKVQSDPDTKAIKFQNNADLMLLVNYLDIRDNHNPDYEVRLKTSPYLQIIYVPTKEKAIDDKRKNSISLFGEDSRDIKATIDEFESNTSARKKALKYAIDIISEKRTVGLYIYSSEYQIGKTYLANAIVNKLADHGKTGIFLFAPSFVRQSKDFDNQEERIKRLNQAEVLVIDDIGAEYSSEWFRRDILMPILQHRLTHKQLTIFTSNYSIIELIELYKKNGKYEGKELERLMSRLYELTDEVKLDE